MIMYTACLSTVLCIPYWIMTSIVQQDQFFMYNESFIQL